MSGIVGYAGRNAGAAITDVRYGVDLLDHRGPDSRALSDLGDCVLGHTRLRVMDTSASADQPMQLTGSDVSIVFNGEIYNFADLQRRLVAGGHRFQTAGDTEVILHLYQEDGIDLVDRLEGMFAFALWDGRQRRLILARDRLGIKPLYYRLTQDGVSFASEVECLVSPRTSLRPSAIATYLRMGWVAGPETIFSDVYELPPGRRLVWHDGESAVSRYWPEPETGDGPVPGLSDLSSALREAVKRQLAANVPLGLLLSSGVESVVLTRLATEEMPGVRGFTVEFDTSPDEADAASGLARQLGLNHTVVTVSAASILRDLDAMVRRMGQPSAEGATSWVMSRAVREAGLVVALAGLGGDELFRGPATFRNASRIERAGRVARFIPGPLSTSALRALAHVPSVDGSRALRTSEAVLHGGHRAAYAAMRSLFSVHELDRLWPDIRSVIDPTDGILRDGTMPVGTTPVTASELANYLPFQLLRDTDAMSMAHSLEVRLPLLDDGVVDVVLRRQRSGRRAFDKASLLAAAGPGLLPPASQAEPTFTLPFDRWMREPLRDRVRASVLGLADTGLGFNPSALARVWRGFEDGHVGWRPMWALAVLSDWLTVMQRSEAIA
jgi:asparagine synthase (glutamine-hydrolysing)